MDSASITVIRCSWLRRSALGFTKGLPLTTSQLDELAAETAAAMTANHPDYASLPARIVVSNLHKNTKKSFSETIKIMYNHFNERSGLKAPLIADDVYEIIIKKSIRLDSETYMIGTLTMIFKALERSYLLKVQGKHMMSQRWFTHASPTLFNAGTPRPQLGSCFLVCMKDDSIEGIYDTLKKCAVISKSAGGIGVAVHNIRATGSYIHGTNGTSNGIVPMLRVFNDTARYVDQGGGKRKGAFAVYLEPWHADIFEFLDLRKNHGKEEHRARDLFYALWLPDLFMQSVQSNGQWSLFCPNESPGLADCWGEEFEKLYTHYEREGKAKKVVQAQNLWFEILKSQIETGTPCMLFKQPANLGTIKSSNFCTEIVEYASPTETTVCNRASIALPRYVRDRVGDTWGFHWSLIHLSLLEVEVLRADIDFDKLTDVTEIVTRNLNKIIDVNYYPVETAKRSNLRHRPIGIGVQGLADTFILLGMAFDSPEAQLLNKDIFETIYSLALSASSDIAEKEGPYEAYNGSPVSKGILQPDMWGPSDRWNWSALREKIAKKGVRNSLLLIPMPTASTSQILGNNECFEPYTSNIYGRRVLRFILGLETRMYYLRSRAAVDAIKFTVDTSMLKEKPKVEDDDTKMAQMVCSLTNREECVACGS
ncbi:hypothetical protein PTKIN_Ptkin07bG0086600 [Pterospermum kingtungense]